MDDSSLLVVLYVTVEPLNNGHIGTSHLVEWLSSLRRFTMYCYNREGTSKCVLYREVFSIVYSNLKVCPL